MTETKKYVIISIESEVRNIDEKRPQPRRPSKKELKDILLKKLQQWQDEGCTVEQAVGKLSMKQYDFLVDQNVNLELLTPEQQKAVNQITHSPRALKPDGYDKKYPPEKIALYEEIKKLIETLGGEVEPREKENFRNLDFVLDGIKYGIVLSNPRSKTKK